MNRPAAARLEQLGHGEKLEGLSTRWGLPHVPEYEVAYLRNLFAPELDAALAEAEAAVKAQPDADAYAWRGRVRRLTGDVAGAVRDFERALDLEPGNAMAQEWLGEATLGTEQALVCLSRALEADSRRARLYRGAARLLAGDRTGAAKDLEAYLREHASSCLGHLLAGVAAGKGPRALKHSAAAAKLDPACAAAHILLSKAERSEARAARAMEGALNADPTLALITLSWYRPGANWRKHIRKLRTYALQEPEGVAWYYRQEEIRYSPYHFQEYADARAIAADRPSAWARALVGRGACRCPPDAERAQAGMEALQAAVAASPASGWLYAWRALAWIQKGHPERALEDFNECVRRQPYYHRGYAWRGALLRKLGRCPEAVADLDRALAVDELYAFAWHERSLARRGMQDWAGAAWDLDRAFSLDHRYRWVFAVGREPGAAETAAAFEELERALAAYPSVPSLHVWRGQLKLERGDLAGGYQDLNRASQLDPHHAAAQAWQGWGLLQAGRHAPAVERLRRALELDPGLWIAHGWLAEAEFRWGNREAAFRILESVRRSKPTTAWIYQQRASLQLEAGKPRRALADLEKSIALEGRHADAYELLARVRLGLSDVEGAHEAVEKALAVSPNHGRAFLLRTAIREKAGRHGAVVEDYRVALERFPYLFNAEQKGRIEALLNA